MSVLTGQARDDAMIEIARELDPARGFFAPQERNRRTPQPTRPCAIVKPGRRHRHAHARLQERQADYDRNFSSERGYKRPGSLNAHKS